MGCDELNCEDQIKSIEELEKEKVMSEYKQFHMDRIVSVLKGKLTPMNIDTNPIMFKGNSETIISSLFEMGLIKYESLKAIRNILKLESK